MSQVNAFTVDVEDYFQVSAFERHIDRRRWGDYEVRVVRNTHRVLNLLEQYGTRATFFVLGWVAHRFPQLVRDIQRAGHEVGSHGYWHRLIYNQTPEQFRSDLRQSRDVLEDILGEPVKSYRAPSFSVTQRSLWALDVLLEEGFTVDSSIFPVRHDRYGLPDAKLDPHRISRTAGRIWEFPMTVYQMGRWNVPVSGGGYFRLYPARFSVAALRSVNRNGQRPFVFYIHPWELDPDQPRLSGSLSSRWRHYQNLASTETKLRHLLGAFRFNTVGNVLGHQNGGGEG